MYRSTERPRRDDEREPPEIASAMCAFPGAPETTQKLRERAKTLGPAVNPHPAIVGFKTASRTCAR